MKLFLILMFFCSRIIASSAASVTVSSSETPDRVLSYAEKLSGRDGFLDHTRQKDLRQEGKSLLQSLRSRDGSSTISEQDYSLLKGASAGSIAHEAHSRGITGEGITVLLLEDSGLSPHRYVESDPLSDTAPVSETWESVLSHGRAMAHYVTQVAPRSRIIVQHIRKGLRSPGEARIINASFSSSSGSVTYSQLFEDIVREYQPPRRLIVSSAGNHQEDLSSHPYWSALSRDVLSMSIFAGNLKQNYRTKTSSGIPGANPGMQDNFVWVIADKMLTATGPRDSSQLSPETGTSGAAAILSGAAALILSKYPELTIPQLKAILLESADRDFIQLFHEGSDGIRITDTSHSDAPLSGAGASAASRILTKSYDPSIWGKGVLNIRNALIYADILVEHPDWDSATIRQRMLDRIADIENLSAAKIQRAFRERARRLSEAELSSRAQLYIDTSKEPRTFEKSGGEEYMEPSVRDEDDILFAERMGIPSRKTSGLKRVSTRATGSTKSSSAAESDDTSSRAGGAASGGGAAGAPDTSSARIAILPADLPAEAPEELRGIRAKSSSAGIGFKNLLSTSDIADLLHPDRSRRIRAWEKYSDWLLTPMDVTFSDGKFYTSRGITLLELIADSLEYRDSTSGEFQRLLHRAVKEGKVRTEHDPDIIIAAWAISGERTYVKDLDSLLDFPRSFDSAIISHLARVEYGATVADRTFEYELLGILGFLSSDKQDFHDQQLDKIIRLLTMLDDDSYDNASLRRLIRFTTRFRAASTYFGKEILDNPEVHDNYPLYDYSTRTVNEENMALMRRLLSHFNDR